MYDGCSTIFHRSSFPAILVFTVRSFAEGMYLEALLRASVSEYRATSVMKWAIKTSSSLLWSKCFFRSLTASVEDIWESCVSRAYKVCITLTLIFLLLIIFARTYL